MRVIHWHNLLGVEGVGRGGPACGYHTVSALAALLVTSTCPATGSSLPPTQESNLSMQDVPRWEVCLSSLTHLLGFATALFIYNHGNNTKTCTWAYFGP